MSQSPLSFLASSAPSNYADWESVIFTPPADNFPTVMENPYSAAGVFPALPCAPPLRGNNSTGYSPSGTTSSSSHEALFFGSPTCGDTEMTDASAASSNATGGGSPWVAASLDSFAASSSHPSSPATRMATTTATTTTTSACGSPSTGLYSLTGAEASPLLTPNATPYNSAPPSPAHRSQQLPASAANGGMTTTTSSSAPGSMSPPADYTSLLDFRAVMAAGSASASRAGSAPTAPVHSTAAAAAATAAAASASAAFAQPSALAAALDSLVPSTPTLSPSGSPLHSSTMYTDSAGGSNSAAINNQYGSVGGGSQADVKPAIVLQMDDVAPALGLANDPSAAASAAAGSANLGINFNNANASASASGGSCGGSDPSSSTYCSLLGRTCLYVDVGEGLDPVPIEELGNRKSTYCRLAEVCPQPSVKAEALRTRLLQLEIATGLRSPNGQPNGGGLWSTPGSAASSRAVSRATSRACSPVTVAGSSAYSVSPSLSPTVPSVSYSPGNNSQHSHSASNSPRASTGCSPAAVYSPDVVVCPSGDLVYTNPEGQSFTIDSDIVMWERQNGLFIIKPNGSWVPVTEAMIAERTDLQHIRCHYCVNGPNVGQKRSKYLVKCRVSGCNGWYCQTHYPMFSGVRGLLETQNDIGTLADLKARKHSPFVCRACNHQCCCSPGNPRCKNPTEKACATFGQKSHKCEKVRHRVYNTTKRKQNKASGGSSTSSGTKRRASSKPTGERSRKRRRKSDDDAPYRPTGSAASYSSVQLVPAIHG